LIFLLSWAGFSGSQCEAPLDVCSPHKLSLLTAALLQVFLEKVAEGEEITWPNFGNQRGKPRLMPWWKKVLGLHLGQASMHGQCNLQ
jgi:hypothetical protein